MSLKPADREELLSLLSALCDGVLTAQDLPRLEQLASSPAGMALYRSYLELHGSLNWDTALASSPASSMPLHAIVATSSGTAGGRKPSRTSLIAGGALTVLLAVVLVAMVMWSPQPGFQMANQDSKNLSQSDQPGPHSPPLQDTAVRRPGESANPVVERPQHRPIDLDWGPKTPDSAIANKTDQDKTGQDKTMGKDEAALVASRADAYATPHWNRAEVVERINDEVRAGWQSAGVRPSAPADDGTWLRRVSLDLAGHVPSLAELDAFVADRRADKRARKLEVLLSSADAARHLANVWSVLLIGRNPPQSVDRDAFRKFLRMSFAENLPWNKMVGQMLAAEGRSDQRGETNFLIAHLNNQAVPATAFTSRVFLGIQLQCVQCHKHPENGQSQTAFWEFNSFFKQTHSRSVTGQRDGALRSIATELYNDTQGGPNFFETRFGVMQVAFPRFGVATISADAGVNRRNELARLMTNGRQPQLAAAFVNRIWEQFFGYALTRVVDDMGPHAPSHHPELLAGLANAFIDSGYDIRQMQQWICQSEAYQLGSDSNATNSIDDPATGEPPLFSKSYLRSLSVEQLCDSLMTVTHAHQASAADWETAQQHRQKWLNEFVHSRQTDENDESNTLAGMQQALLLMNGELIEQALEDVPGTFLHDVLHQPGNETVRIRKLCRAVLSREPTGPELASLHKLMRARAASKPGSAEPYQDLLWALLNSNEFALVR